MKIRVHVPIVHGMAGPKTVEIEEGEEALYPSAERWVVIPRASDDVRRGKPRVHGPPRRFIPRPHVEPKGLPTADVVICPRSRRYVTSRNWPHWDRLAEALTVRGISTIAAGAPDSSASVPCPVAWDWDRFLDASIRAMLNARLVISTDAGLAHLAVLCGRPLLIITHGGRAGPGVRVQSDGFTPEPGNRPMWFVNLHHYYEDANHQGVPIRLIDAWRSPELVAEWADLFLREGKAPGFKMPDGYQRFLAPRLI